MYLSTKLCTYATLLIIIITFHKLLGMIGEIVAGRADVAAEDFQANSQRFNAVEFTHHFLYQPNAILLKQQDSHNIMVLDVHFVGIEKIINITIIVIINRIINL